LEENYEKTKTRNTPPLRKRDHTISRFASVAVLLVKKLRQRTRIHGNKFTLPSKFYG
jgi:hypothetical protein